MEKEFWRSFLRFLDEADDAELRERLSETQAFAATARTAEVKSDARQMIRFMEQELLARAQVRAIVRPK
jgi:hypothetical protein